MQKVVQASIKALEQNLAVIEQAAIEKAAKYLSSSVFRDFYGLAVLHKSRATQPLNFCVLACEPQAVWASLNL